MLMEGIEIVNKIEIMENHFLIPILAGVFLALGFCCMITGLPAFFEGENKGRLFLMVLFFAGFIALFIKMKNPSTPTGEYHYEVILDNTVNLKEFYQKYEIIEIKGNLYTVKEKK